LPNNAIQWWKQPSRAEHGNAEANQLSKYYMALEISSTNEGMSVVLEDSDFDTYCDMPVAEFCTSLA